MTAKLTPAKRALWERYERALLYELRLQEARDDFGVFCEMMMPGEDPDDPMDTEFVRKPFHDHLIEIVQRLADGRTMKVLLSAPPRHGKTQTTTILHAAWFIGRNPKKDVMVATYSKEMAEREFSQNFLAIVSSHRFSQVFPDFGLNPELNSAGVRATIMGGKAYFVGRESLTTGLGGDCFPAGTRVATDQGDVPIERLLEAPEAYRVRTMDPQTKEIGHARIAAVSARQATGLRRITTASGRVVTATGEHPFYSRGRWIKAADVAPGDPLLRLLQGGVPEDGVQLPEVRGARRGWPLLLDGLRQAAREHLAVWRAHLHRVWQPGAEGDLLRNHRSALLLGGMQGCPAGAPEGRPPRETHAALSYLSSFVRAAPRRDPARAPELQQRVRGGRPFAPDERRGQSEVETRGDAAPSEACGEGVQADAAADTGARWPLLRRLRLAAQPARPPHRRGSDEQRVVELGGALLVASSDMAREEGRETVEDTVAVVERLRGVEATVYDLQIEPTHCFFAEGLLVHNCVLIDDPIKNEKEARSETYREGVWEWFRKTIYTRRHNLGKSPIMLTATRWTSDDVTGRISDPANIHYNETFAKGWDVINIPALATENNDILGRNKDEALWPEKHPADELKASQALDPVGFSCLYQGNPVPDQGVVFQSEDLVEYDRAELEEIKRHFRIYCFSDHAYGETKYHDPSCFVAVGLAPNGDCYFLPDIFWDRVGTDAAVEQMLDMMRRRRPLTWYAENGHIYKALEPFLKKRMREESVSCWIEPVWPKASRDQKGTGKFTRSQAALARCKMGKFKFPSFAPWWPRAKAELMTFPNGSNDDFVDVVSLVGLQIDRIAGLGAPENKPRAEPGTYEALFGDDEDLITHRGANVGGGWTNRAFS